MSRFFLFSPLFAQPVPTMKPSAKLVYLLCAAYGPMLVALHYLTWLIGRLVLGHWPRPSIDDPMSISGVWVPHYLTTGFTLLLPAVALVPIGMVVVAMQQREPGTVRNIGAAVAVLAMLAACVVFLRLDPHQVAVWHAD